MMTYKIVRHFADGDSEVIEMDLTLAEAKAHCKDPNTSSRTATDEAGVKLTEERGMWFDGFTEE